jgi:transcription initiation factor TFIID subunit 13
VDDFKVALRNDPTKLGRVEELLHLQKVISEARKQFDTDDGKGG